MLAIAARELALGFDDVHPAIGPGDRHSRGASPARTPASPSSTFAACAAVMTGGDIGFAEGFMAGEWDTPDLTAVLECAGLNFDRLEGDLVNGNPLSRAWNYLAHLLRHRTPGGGSKRNIRRSLRSGQRLL